MKTVQSAQRSPASLVVVIGRADDCDLHLDDATVSGHHARLSWSARRIVVEDLGSANGVFVSGKRVARAMVRPGDDVRLGDVQLAWSAPGLRAFLRGGARGDTMIGMRKPGRAFTCGACGAAGVLPSGASGKRIKCASCHEELTLERPEGRSALAWLAVGFLLVTAVAVAAVAVWVWAGPGAVRKNLAEVAAAVVPPVEETVDAGPPPTSAEEAAIRARSAQAIGRAIDSSSPITRNLAVRVAAGSQGTFSLDQVAQLWTYVRGRWKYVNDPRGADYFALASETITNEFAGDCDDFAIVLVAMVTAIGGDARLVMMDGPEGGHAYAEVCLEEPPAEVAATLKRHYLRTWDRYLGRQRVRSISFRTSATCPVWLNLDWSAGVPGGPYVSERWAVSVHPDGATETLGAAGSASASNTPGASTVQQAALPPR
jgi:hypothetical protein